MCRFEAPAESGPTLNRATMLNVCKVDRNTIPSFVFAIDFSSLVVLYAYTSTLYPKSCYFNQVVGQNSNFAVVIFFVQLT